MSAHLIARAKAKVEEAFARAEAHYGRKLKRVPVSFSKRMTSTAGTARYYRGTLEPVEIKLSLPYLLNNTEEFLGRTPGHEAAHIIAIHLFGKDGLGHGRRWKEVMAVIGNKAERCHSMALPAAIKPVYLLKCGCTTHKVGKTVYDRAYFGRTRYSCKKCRTFCVAVK